MLTDYIKDSRLTNEKTFVSIGEMRSEFAARFEANEASVKELKHSLEHSLHERDAQLAAASVEMEKRMSDLHDKIAKAQQAKPNSPPVRVPPMPASSSHSQQPPLKKSCAMTPKASSGYKRGSDDLSFEATFARTVNPQQAAEKDSNEGKAPTFCLRLVGFPWPMLRDDLTAAAKAALPIFDSLPYNLHVGNHAKSAVLEFASASIARSAKEKFDTLKLVWKEDDMTSHELRIKHDSPKELRNMGTLLSHGWKIADGLMRLEKPDTTFKLGTDQKRGILWIRIGIRIIHLIQLSVETLESQNAVVSVMEQKVANPNTIPDKFADKIVDQMVALEQFSLLK